MRKSIYYMAIGPFLIIFLTSCAGLDTITDVVTEVGVQKGTITASQAESIRRGKAAVLRTLEDFTPEQEYFIGRSVGAVILSRYRLLDDVKINEYLNLMGRTLAASSDMPEIFAGYSFAVIDSEDINAFATPGGHIFITRGLIKCCRTEDALAAVVAHEIGHVQLRHGLQAIEKARRTEALTVLLQEGVRELGSRELAQLTKNFGGIIADIVNTMVNNGYSRAFEFEADAAAVSIMRRAGYNPAAIFDMLTVMAGRLNPKAPDFAKTHPSPQSRITALQQSGFSLAGSDVPFERTQRFKKATHDLMK